jgi:YesN/AraC family two-component response regulator
MHSLPEIQQQMTDLIMECIRLDDMSEINAKSKMHMAVRYIQEHYNENISVNDLAERYDMSSNYFSAIFKKEQHQSPVDYITTLRVKKAMELLECSDKSVVDIAKKVGYEEASYFYRVFKKYTGMTPLHYREQHR